MSDQIISINSWVQDRSRAAGPGVRLSIEQLEGLMQGCVLIFEQLGPKLSMRVELIKIVPYKYYGDDNIKYDVRIIFALPVESGETQKLECEANIDLYRYPKNLDLNIQLHKKVIGSVAMKFKEYDNYLERKRKILQGYSSVL